MNVPLLLLSIAAVALLMLGFTLAGRRAMAAFEIEIAGGKAFLRRGRPRAGFLSDVQEIAGRNGIERGTIRGIGSGRKIRLTFAGPIPEEARQQMRNAWSLLR